VRIWPGTAHHNAAGENVTYRYSYLFVHPLDLQPGTNTITLPENDNVRILAISVADENAAVKPAHPLYDVLQPSKTGH
jgi:alpha-mannosidase